MKPNKIVIKTIDNKIYSDIYQNRFLENGRYLTTHSLFRNSFDSVDEAKKISTSYLISIGNEDKDIEVILE